MIFSILRGWNIGFFSFVVLTFALAIFDRLTSLSFFELELVAFAAVFFAGAAASFLGAAFWGAAPGEDLEVVFLAMAVMNYNINRNQQLAVQGIPVVTDTATDWY
jgi:hypothetical protein